MPDGAAQPSKVRSKDTAPGSRVGELLKETAETRRAVRSADATIFNPCQEV